MAETLRYQVDSDASSDKMPDYAAYQNGEIDVERGRYPYCLVWTPIPLLT